MIVIRNKVVPRHRHVMFVVLLMLLRQMNAASLSQLFFFAHVNSSKYLPR